MIRAAIQRQGLIIPAPDELVATFGWRLEFDEQTHTECYSFTDDFRQFSKLWVGTADRTFGLSVRSEQAEILRIYDENLRSIHLDEKRQVVQVTLGAPDTEVQELVVWPRISVLIKRMRIPS